MMNLYIIKNNNILDKFVDCRRVPRGLSSQGFSAMPRTTWKASAS